MRISLTGAGADLVQVITRARRAEIARILAEMPCWGRAQVIEGLRAFADAAGEVPEQNWSLVWGDPAPPRTPTGPAAPAAT